MYLFHSTVQTHLDKAKAFVDSHGGLDDPIHAAPGFVRRILLKDKENPGRFFYISIWRSEADLQAYRQTDPVKARVAAMQGQDIFAQPIDRVECEIVGEEEWPEVVGY